MSYLEAVYTPVEIFMVAALGLYLITQAGRMSVGHAAFFGIGAYTSGILSLSGWPFIAGLLSGAVAAAMMGFVLASIIERLNLFFFAIATLAFGEMMKTVAANIPALGGGAGLSDVPLRVGLSGVTLTLLIVVALIIVHDRSKWGRRARAVKDSVVGTRALGISPSVVRIRAFALGSGIAGIAGGLWAHYLGLVQPADLGFERSFILLVYVTLGGTDNVLGPILGSALLGLLPEWLRFSAGNRTALYGAVITIVMVVLPGGLVSLSRFARLDWRSTERSA